MSTGGVCKFVFLCFFLSVVSGRKLVPLTDDPHSIYQCPDTTLLDDYPLCSSSINVGGQLFTTITRTVECPDSGLNRKKIGCIMVTDKSENDEGGYATITNGGLDQYFVEIRLKSQWGKGLNYQLNIYTLADTTTASTTSTKSP